MSERVTMPALGESVTEGTVTRWLKNVGDTVEVDEPLLEVSNDKVDTEIPSPVAGVLQEILAQEDDTVPVGADLAVVGDGSGGSDSSDQGGQQDAGEQPSQEQASAESQEPPAEAPSTEQAPQESTSEPEQSQQQDAAPQGGSGDGASGETVTMPALGESVTEGTVTRWLKAEGDAVEVDEPLLEVSTDKVDTEIPSPFAGTLTKILVQEDDTVPVGGDLAVIGGSGSSAEVKHAQREHGSPVTAVSREPIPFDGFPVVAFYPVAVGIELPKERHGLDVALVLDPARRDGECGEIIASLICTVGEIEGVLPVRSRSLRGRRRRASRGTR